MITGEAAFRRSSRAATLSAVLHEEPKPTHELRPDVPAEVVKLVSRCLRKDPDRRLRSMADLALALRELKEESESGAISQPPPRARHRNTTVAALIAAGAIILASVVGIDLWRDRFRALHSPELTPITTYPGLQMNPSLSPDGSQVAFSWNRDAKEMPKRG
jgi:eukaryotic-like serine/threonine-protein kinase